MDYLAWIELLESSKKIINLINPKIWCKKIIYFYNYYCRSPYNILIYGCSGAGKSEFIRALLDKQVTEYPTQRTQTIDDCKMVFSNGRKIRFYDLPGHVIHISTRQIALNMISQKKIKGIINVVTYGYNEVEDHTISDIFCDTNSNHFIVKESYLAANKKLELKQIEEWMTFIHNNSNVKCVMTVVTKADIWYLQKEQVLSYYKTGMYYKKCIEKLSKICHTSVFPYCSIISPFGNKPMFLSFNERDKQRMHREFKEELFKIIKNGNK